MQEDYIRESRIVDKTDIEKEMDLIRNIIKVNEELNTANSNFQFAEEELIDYYTYQIKAHQSKLNYLIKQAKTRGITNDMINQIKLKLLGEELDVG
ncbi:MAG: YaaL family protein [Clostridia bacterium]|nr:YaaL family protein [Clostridia bacterium]